MHLLWVFIQINNTYNIWYWYDNPSQNIIIDDDNECDINKHKSRIKAENFNVI